MSEERQTTDLYRVVYSERVRQSIRELVARARKHGLGLLVLEAVKQMDRRLSLYPQFGDPLLDLTQEAGRIWIGTIPPLVVRYAIYDERRLVIVANPIQPLPGSEF